MKRFLVLLGGTISLFCVLAYASDLKPAPTTYTLKSAPLPLAMFEPDWQIHAKWCTTDRGSSHGAYMANCVRYDQFDSVIACQQDAGNGAAVSAIQAAGRATVNAFMDNYKPPQCK